ncbi:hypothetical protein QNM99_04570 [Pseudomonas sp. PCH446]
MIDTAELLQRAVQRVDRGTGNAEGGVHPFAAHHQDGSFDCSHFAHYFVPLAFYNCIQVAVWRVYSRWVALVNAFSKMTGRSVLRPFVWILSRLRRIFVYKNILYCVLLIWPDAFGN